MYITDNRTTRGWVSDAEGLTNKGWIDILDVVTGEILYRLYQVYTDNTYVYAATSEGLKIYDLESELLYALVNYVDGFTTLWGNQDKIFLGTTSSGIRSIATSDISGNTSDPTDLTSYVSDAYSTPYLNSDYIKYIHGNDTNLMICTDSGVEYIKTEGNPTFVTSTTIAGAQKCYLSSTAGYYTISGTEWGLNRIDNMNSSWSEPTRSYITGDGILASDIYLNDMYITEGTGENSVSNCVFCATSSGVYIIDESDFGTEISNRYYTAAA